jgi:hypothetical protein
MAMRPSKKQTAFLFVIYVIGTLVLIDRLTFG